MPSRFTQNRVVMGSVIAAGLCVVLSLGLTLGLFYDLNSTFTDNLYTRNEPSSDIVIIGIDDKSTDAVEGFGRYNQWTRERFTQLLSVLKKESPKVVAMDFIFSTYTEQLPRTKLLELEDKIDNSADNKAKLNTYDDFFGTYSSTLSNPIDNDLALALQGFDNLVLAASLKYNGTDLIKPLEKFAPTARLGVVNAFLDSTGILRNAIAKFSPTSEKISYDDFAIATAKEFLGKDNLELPLDNENNLLVNYFGDPYSFKQLSFVDVAKGKIEPGTLKNKIVLVGATSPKEVHDEYFTPRSNTTPMSGVEFRANEIQTILDGKFLVRQGVASEIFTLLLILLGLTVAFNYLGIWPAVAVAVMSSFGYYLIAHLLYSRGLLVNMVYPFLAIILAFMSSWVYKYFVVDRKKREMVSAFSHYVSAELVSQIGKNPDMVKLGGERKVVTVFFSDIKDSTKLSESHEISEWVAQINEYFTAMEGVLKQYDGTLDKYEGDAIMGFWNAPLTQVDHVKRSFSTAIEMQKRLKELNEKWLVQEKPCLEIRIGINTGEALVGNFGSVDRFDYTVMGDTVNTASRLESAANKTYCTNIIAAGFEGEILPEYLGEFVLRELDTVYLPGKKEPVKLFEVVCFARENNLKLAPVISGYAEGLVFYKAGKFVDANRIFSTLAGDFGDKPSQVMADRTKRLVDGEVLPQLGEDLIFRIEHK